MDDVLNNSKCVIPPKQFALLSTLIGIAFTENLDIDQQNALGNFLINIGQAMVTVAAQQQILKDDGPQNDMILQEIDKLKAKLATLEKKIC